jgi:hypothetical protein
VCVCELIVLKCITLEFKVQYNKRCNLNIIYMYIFYNYGHLNNTENVFATSDTDPTSRVVNTVTTNETESQK